MPLTPDQLQHFRQKLRARYDELRTEIAAELQRQDSQGYVDIMDRVHDEGDESLADLLRDLDIAEIDRHVREAEDIEAALQRIAELSYGVCEGCGGDIPPERLEVEPTATRCVSCQTLADRTHATPGTPKL